MVCPPPIRPAPQVLEPACFGRSSVVFECVFGCLLWLVCVCCLVVVFLVVALVVVVLFVVCCVVVVVCVGCQQINKQTRMNFSGS